jgi:hypothetical protein
MGETKTGGGWACVYRVRGSGEAFFHDDAEDVDEATARRVFGRCIRAGELGLQVEGFDIDAVRLLRLNDGEKRATVLQMHVVGALARWKADAQATPESTPPYREDAFHPGVPCCPGAWGSSESCAMHWGLPLDENGLCAEGHRGAKLLGLIVVPKAMQKRWDLPATITSEEAEENEARAVIELVKRGKTEGLTEQQLARAVEVLEGQLARTKAANALLEGFVQAAERETDTASPHDRSCANHTRGRGARR